MENDYASPKEILEILENIVCICQGWIKVIIDAKGTEQEGKIMKEFNAVDIQSILFETV